MRTPARPAATAVALAAAALIAGCGSATPAAHSPAAEAPPGGAPFLATTMVTAGGTWAVAVMGGSVASHNNFWQVFARPAGSSSWKLVTPAGTPDNGGLVLASAGKSLITGLRPSQYLTYTPLTTTADGGHAWSSAGPLDAALADVPDALAAAPRTGQLLALTTGGTAEEAAPGYTNWKALATQRAVAATPAGRTCGLRALSAVAYTPTGMPVLAGTCSRPGAVGIFGLVKGAWLATGPPMPSALDRQHITVLRLTQTASQVVALLAAGSGHAASLLAAWSADNGHHWTLSPALTLGGAPLASASFGPAGTVAVMTTAGRADIITGGGSSWHPLPSLPAGTATLASGTGGHAEAMAVHGSTLTIWQYPADGSAWTKTQVINVPIQYGSSG